MLKVARSICDLYSTLDRDLLYSGVILHDMGKTQELSGPIAPQHNRRKINWSYIYLSGSD